MQLVRTAPATNRISVMRMEQIWRDAIRRSDPGGRIICITVTSTELKQLSHIRRVADQAGVDVGCLLEWVVPHWHQFGHQVRFVKDYSTYAIQPHIGFLLTHCAVAINMMVDEHAREVKRRDAQKAADAKRAEASAAQREPAPTEEPVKVTAEDLAEMLVGLHNDRLAQPLQSIAAAQPQVSAQPPVKQHVPHKMTDGELAEMLAALKE